MGPLAAGEVVLVPFPFSDLSGSKVRPALCLAKANPQDWICCQITSGPYNDPFAIAVGGQDFVRGGLQTLSYVRPGKHFTASSSLFVRSVGAISQKKHDDVVDAVIAILKKP